MKTQRKLAIAIALALLLAPAQASVAQSGGGYDLTWSAVDGGGVTFSAGGAYELGATIGQADAQSMGGNGYTLSGGFWAGIPPNYRAFMPITLRGP